MDHIRQDIRFGIRMLVKHPTLSVISILTFGLGIGISTTVFSVVNGAMFKGLPYQGAERLVTLSNTNPSRKIQGMGISVQDIAVWQERQTVFESMGPFSVGPLNISWEEGAPERFRSGLFSVGAFDALGVKPLLGRAFRSEDERHGAEPVILLGYDLWRDRFGSRPDIVGRTVRANGVLRSVIGVMPQGFAYPAFEKVWTPLEADPLATQRGKGPSYMMVARLRRGVSIKEAQSQATAIAARLAEEYPDTNKGIYAAVKLYTETFLGDEIYALLFTMLGAGAGVLLIACVNVANLLLARAARRSREIAVRIALGAGRRRVVMQLLTEVLVLASIGGIIGVFLSWGAMKWFLNAIETNPPPFWITFELDHRVFLYVGGATLTASLLAGLIPALQATGKHIGEVLKDESRASTGLHVGRFSGGLVIAEVALSCGLLIAAGLMIKSVVQLKTVEMPFATERIFTARINLPRLKYPDDASCIRFYEQLLPKLQSIRGVEAATLSDGLPAAGNGTIAIQIEGQVYSQDSEYPVVREGIVTPGYFQTFQTRVLRGREFTVLDRPGNQMTALVNESFARTYFPGSDPMGRHIKKGRNDPKAQWLTVVGIVPDMIMQGIGNNNQGPAGYYIPIAQSDVTNFVSMALRTRVEPMEVTTEVRAAVASMDPDLAIYDTLSMGDVIKRQTWFYTVFGTFFMAFGFCALFLAIAGLYGVMAFAVSQRTREMGIRVALGAQGGQLVGLIMKRGVTQIALGLGIGFTLAMLAVKSLQPILYHVSPRDPMVLATVLLGLSAAGLIASFLPARRVTMIDPVIALAVE